MAKKIKPVINFVRLRDAVTQNVFPWKPPKPGNPTPYDGAGIKFTATKIGGKPKYGTLHLLPAEGGNAPERLTPFDGVVNNGISSLVLAGVYEITPAMLCQLLTGKKGGQKKYMEARIKESLNRLLSWEIIIKTDENFSLKNKQLPLLCPRYQYDPDTGRLFINEQPVLYQYAGFKNYLDTVPVSWNIMPVNMSLYALAAREYFYYMYFMNRIKNPSFSILHQHLYIAARGQERSFQTSKQRIRLQMGKMLYSLTKPLKNDDGNIIREPILKGFSELSTTGQPVRAGATPCKFLVFPANLCLDKKR